MLPIKKILLAVTEGKAEYSSKTDSFILGVYNGKKGIILNSCYRYQDGKTERYCLLISNDHFIYFLNTCLILDQFTLTFKKNAQNNSKDNL
jgi:hypothetical protein